MKRRCGSITALLVVLLLLASCGAAPGSQTQTASSVGSTVITAAPDSVSSGPASAPAQAVESTAPESEAIYPSELTYYENIEDIPNLNLSISNDDLGSILKDGNPFLAAPGPGHFENPVFADSTYLYVRAVLPDGYFQWYFFAWDMGNMNDILIPDSVGKMFTSVDGTKLVCDDGSSYDTATGEWV